MKFRRQSLRWFSVAPLFAVGLCSLLDGAVSARSGAAEIGTRFCFANSGCPCGNNAFGNTGCANLYDPGSALLAYGSTSVAADDMTLQCSYGGDIALLFGNSFTAPSPALMGDGLRCVGLPIRRLGVRVTTGIATWGPGLAAIGPWGAGDTWYFQVAYRNTSGSPCVNLKDLNVSSAVAVTFTP